MDKEKNAIERLKAFEALNVSSKFAICGLPIRVDTYKNCTFGCIYCFSNNRKICEFEKTFQIANLKSIEKRLDRIFNKRKVDSTNFLDTLIAQGITWHCGGMSDPFQPIEDRYHITSQMIDICETYYPYCGKFVVSKNNPEICVSSDFYWDGTDVYWNCEQNLEFMRVEIDGKNHAYFSEPLRVENMNVIDDLETILAEMDFTDGAIDFNLSYYQSVTRDQYGKIIEKEGHTEVDTLRFVPEP